MECNNGSLPRRAALIGIFTAQAIVLSFLEHLLPPMPILPPGAKLGLSNLIVLFTAMEISVPAALCVAVMKSFFVLLTRGGTAFTMSLFGGVLSALVMGILVRRRISLGLIGICVMGAVSHNIGQLLAASLLSASNLLFYLPALLLFGALAGFVTGIIIRYSFPLLQKQCGAILRSGEIPHSTSQ